MASNTMFPRPIGSQNLKRKLNDPTTSFSRTSSKKATKHSESDSPRGNTNGRVAVPRTATVEDEPEQSDDQEAGPALPPDDAEDADDEPENDEEGRFFGGGVSKEEKDVLDYIDQNEDAVPDEEINLAWLKKTALNFERKINKNAELRVKYEDEPMKFVSSEADLDSEIKGLSLLNDHPELYKDFVRSGCSNSLVSLLSHDNTDIAIAACEVISDLIDEDSEVPAADWSDLVKSMLKADLISLLVSNLGRLNEATESDNAGVYHVLNVIENLLSDPVNTTKFGSQSALLTWLLQRVRNPDKTSANNVGQNRQYAAEILVILAQGDANSASVLVSQGAVDTILQLLSTWRRRDPEKDSEEEEFASNLFDCLVAIVHTASGRDKFVQDEGVELCLLMIKEGKFAKNAALRILDHATAGFDCSELCERIVEAGGLKQLFTLLMKSTKLERWVLEHLIGIMAALLRVLPGGSPARIRTLAKFVEKDYEKSKRLVELRTEYADKLAAVDKMIDLEKSTPDAQVDDDAEDDHLSRRMEAGLVPLQVLDVILAWLIAEDDGARKFLVETLQTREIHTQGMEAIQESLSRQLKDVELAGTPDSMATKDMLQALIACLM